MAKARCKECKAEIPQAELRLHWDRVHGSKLKQIDKWLGQSKDTEKSWEQVAAAGMEGRGTKDQG